MKSDITAQYDLFRARGIGELPSAILTLTTVIQENIDFEGSDMSHSICMGIRKGLFGAEAGNHSSIIDLKNE